MKRCPTHVDTVEGGFYVCSLCECPLKVHCTFVHCPLLDREVICIDCCSGASDEKVLQDLKDVGKEYTREEVDKICKECGNRCVGDTVEE